MSDASDRLQSARLDAGFKTASDAARYHGWNENTYRSHENGERGLKAKVASKYAKAFKVDYSWLLIGEGEKDKTNLLFLAGMISNSGVVNIKLDEEQRKIVVSIPVSAPSNARCYYIDTESLNPRYGCGDLIVTFYDEIRDSDDIPQEGVLYSSKGVYFGVLIGTLDDGFIIETIGSKPVRDFSVQRFEPVEFIVRRGNYLKDRNFPSRDDADIDE